MTCTKCGSVFGEVPRTMGSAPQVWVCRDCGHRQEYGAEQEKVDVEELKAEIVRLKTQLLGR